MKSSNRIKSHCVAAWIVSVILSAMAAPAAEGAIRLEPVLQGLASPVFVTNAHDGTQRLFVVEQPGRIQALALGAVTPSLFLDITARVLTGSEQGLLGLAFHPQFATNARFFVNYTRKTDGATVIAEYHASPDPGVTAASENILLTIAQPYANHNGGMIEFGPDGYLYVGMGDGGSSNDPQSHAQNINDLLGKILRIDVDHPSGGLAYSSPASNPFAGATAGRDEIFAVGMRNPFRFSFDRLTGQLYVGDVGQNAVEEVDIVTVGGNYGWRVYEGNQCTNNDPGLCTPGNFLAPIAQYAHSGGRCSITGGYVYRGTAAALPTGTYVFGDYCSGEIFSPLNGGANLLLDTALNISSFGEDEAGEIYVVGLGGTVDRIAAITATQQSTNVALASAGALASASSTFSSAYPVSAVNNNERAGAGWSNGGGWNDASGPPSSVQIVFGGTKTIDRVVVHTLQDNYSNPVEPTDTLTFSSYGVRDFTVQGWNGSAWITLGSVTGNNLVKRTVTFAAFTTDRIRVNVSSALAFYSRITEIEAWTPSGAPPPTIAGTVSASGAAQAGVMFTASDGGACTVSDAAGHYACSVPSGWSGTVMPSRNGYAFTPPWRSYGNVATSLGSQDYEAAAIVGGPVPWNGFARDAQHTALSTTASQPLHRVHWQTPMDLNPQYSGTRLLIHYGSPLVTSANTVIVPVKTGATGGFRVEARSGADGVLKWSMTSDYLLPSYSWVPSYGPALTSQPRLYFPGAGGTVYFRDQPDASSGPSGQLAFYGLSNYQANPQAYNATVVINTPITTDPAGNIYFGFMASGGAPLGLTSGIARISAGGQGTWIPVTTASADPAMTKVPHNSAPALSPDLSTLYVAVSNGTNGYLVALDSTTLTPTARVRLIDPKTGQSSRLNDNGTASPTVGSDGDVYFGVFESPSSGSRGWLLHFNANLNQTKTPGAFGWDNTASLVPAQMVPSYQGTSTYLLMSKYNNYATRQHRIAVLDPNATQTDSVTLATVMKEVLTILGPTPDPNGGVFEWCINSAAVDPMTKSVLVNSEDGKLYRWDLTTNTLSQTVVLTPGLGEAYTSTVVGPDGHVYAINNATLFAVGQ